MVEQKCPECNFKCFDDAMMRTHQTTSHGGRKKMKVCQNCSFACTNVWEVSQSYQPASVISHSDDFSFTDGLPLPLQGPQSEEGRGNPLQEVRLHCGEQGRQLGSQEGPHPAGETVRVRRLCLGWRQTGQHQNSHSLSGEPFPHLLFPPHLSLLAPCL